jgi:hypothetical protein
MYRSYNRKTNATKKVARAVVNELIKKARNKKSRIRFPKKRKKVKFLGIF